MLPIFLSHFSLPLWLRTFIITGFISRKLLTCKHVHVSSFKARSLWRLPSVWRYPRFLFKDFKVFRLFTRLFQPLQSKFGNNKRKGNYVKRNSWSFVLMICKFLRHQGVCACASPPSTGCATNQPSGWTSASSATTRSWPGSVYLFSSKSALCFAHPALWICCHGGVGPGGHTV